MEGINDGGWRVTGPPEASERLEEARLRGLRETWAYAREHSPYYAGRLPSIPPEELELRHLRRVPVLTKDELRGHLDEVRCLRGLPAYVVFTGGTTGSPLLLYGAESDLPSPPPPGPGAPLRKLGLCSGGGHHGIVPLIPGRIGYLQVPLRSRENFRWAGLLLRSEHNFEGYEPKIRLAMLPLPALKKLGHFLLEQAFDMSRLDLAVVGTFSFYLSDGWRAWLESVFRARVIDHYGFAEMKQALARECRRCGYYHFGPQTVWEVVDTRSGEPLEEGVGKLLMTSLVPYVRDQVLFRYEPGDLVEVGPYCPVGDDLGLRFVGRMDHATSFEEGSRHRWVLLPTQVQELVDRCQWIGRIQDPRFQDIASTSDDEFPRWRARMVREEGRPVLQIDLEMKSNPVLFSAEWTGFANGLRDGLLRANPVLRRLVGEEKLELRIAGLPPGGLEDSEVFLC